VNPVDLGLEVRGSGQDRSSRFLTWEVDMSSRWKSVARSRCVLGTWSTEPLKLPRVMTCATRLAGFILSTH
jgi:hypothetical protein